MHCNALQWLNAVTILIFFPHTSSFPICHILQTCKLVFSNPSHHVPFLVPEYLYSAGAYKVREDANFCSSQKNLLSTRAIVSKQTSGAPWPCMCIKLFSTQHFPGERWCKWNFVKNNAMHELSWASQQLMKSMSWFFSPIHPKHIITSQSAENSWALLRTFPISVKLQLFKRPMRYKKSIQSSEHLELFNFRDTAMFSEWRHWKIQTNLYLCHWTHC